MDRILINDGILLVCMRLLIIEEAVIECYDLDVQMLIQIQIVDVAIFILKHKLAVLCLTAARHYFLKTCVDIPNFDAIFDVDYAIINQLLIDFIWSINCDTEIKQWASEVLSKIHYLSVLRDLHNHLAIYFFETISLIYR